MWDWLVLPVEWANCRFGLGAVRPSAAGLWIDYGGEDEGCCGESVRRPLLGPEREGPDSGRVGGQTRVTLEAGPSWFAHGRGWRSERRGPQAFILSSSEQRELDLGTWGFGFLCTVW